MIFLSIGTFSKIAARMRLEFFLDRYQCVNTDGDPDLGFDRVLGRTEESLDAKVLFDPFEEEFHLPAAFVQLGQPSLEPISGL